MERVWVGIGSNMLNPQQQADRAIWSISKLPMTRLVNFSSYYRSLPLGDKNQPDFLNAIIILDTNLSPKSLLSHLQYIERKQGRIRSLNSLIWQPRTLDLDILLFGKYFIYTPELTIPHHGMLNREFVLYPLMALDNNLIFPDGRVITDIVKTVPKNGLDFWKE
ncbi:2-amino-4-hydroxy-6-hydroxymethyldihydropteridine diphosphokinase [Blochmannia endosymbiont of Camponotus sp.]|uniref:2-amino-4-hydroxy-6- hydroxymethyldihydropteridine diphosphokinase n=1 Tax=Blochmannia endosymbiont of Camponotus sp. TaxID=700220 RepID=UPI0020257074|nr:2-amino-4-hydroxy-6-hydroxymethyldihydropteridine diphosphokinase [Blochmannia endosymbiont of Camponotus sp.]URJ24072.1 2-amino-4-hydroxy-6-hydroxymethyldihydropteridine diphosphokinase [Blochmannia endosymbiont of Camponotus sp.]URJ25735.1 2-amino-4-hydroxy-6-hydroxymethyldihydropteridine diphosphokinase [Blochmannia endosymbiont of Camponotus sp.]